MATDFGPHTDCVAIKHRILTGFAADNAIAHSACRLDIGVHRVKCPRAVMPDKMQQSSVPVFRSSVTGIAASRVLARHPHL